MHAWEAVKQKEKTCKSERRETRVKQFCNERKVNEMKEMWQANGKKKQEEWGQLFNYVRVEKNQWKRKGENNSKNRSATVEWNESQQSANQGGKKNLG